jgi:hypothetical protein
LKGVTAKEICEGKDMNQVYFSQQDTSKLIAHLLDAAILQANSDFQISLDDGTIIKMNNEMRKKFRAEYDTETEHKINSAFLGYTDLELRNVLEIKKRLIELFPELNIEMERVKK